MDPTGAVILITCVAESTFCQKSALELGGGLALIWAGSETDTVVSESSSRGPYVPSHSTEHVAADPCEAGGVQISISLSLADLAIKLSALFATLHIAPAIPTISMPVMTCAVAEVDVNR